MILNRRFDLLRLDADIPLCGACAAVLQQPLHKGYIEAIGVVDLRSVPLAEAVGADPVEAQVITDDMKLLLDCPFRDGENQVSAPDTVAQTVVLNVLLNHQRDGEHTPLPGLLLRDFQTVAVAIPDNITEAELQNIADPQS